METCSICSEVYTAVFIYSGRISAGKTYFKTCLKGYWVFTCNDYKINQNRILIDISSINKNFYDMRTYKIRYTFHKTNKNFLICVQSVRFTWVGVHAAHTCICECRNPMFLFLHQYKDIKMANIWMYHQEWLLKSCPR